MRNLLFLVGIFSITSCTSYQEIPTSLDDWDQEETPPNGIKISNYFYCDQSEITNFHWKEYLFWTQRTYGKNSNEYKNALLKDAVWVLKDTSLAKYDDFYLSHHAYRDYPLVGVSQQQAIDYSKWRSDRVFEYLLVKYEIIEYDTVQRRDNHFSIERYFNGEIKKLNPDKELYFYPEFRLPTLQERAIILSHSDSLEKAYYERCRMKKCSECLDEVRSIWCNIHQNEFGVWDIDVTRRVDFNCTTKKGDLIYNLRGNVAEWTSENTISVGGSWKDSLVQILQSDTTTVIQPNAWTGFRNVCEWKEWKKDH